MEQLLVSFGLGWGLGLVASLNWERDPAGKVAPRPQLPQHPSRGHHGDFTWKTDLALCFFTLFQMESVETLCGERPALQHTSCSVVH